MKLNECRIRTFIRIRKRKNSNYREELPTTVNKEFIKAIVLNFGGKEWEDI
jgi:hypothetical protein